MADVKRSPGNWHLGDTDYAHGFKKKDRVRDLGDGRTGRVVEVSRSEIRWTPDKQPHEFKDVVYSCHPTMIVLV